MFINLSRNSYMLSPRRVTRTPIGTFALNLKLEMSFFDFVDTAFCPVIEVISSRATSISFLSDTAMPIPLLIQIFSILGTCMIDLYWNLVFRAGIISFLYFSFNLGVAIILSILLFSLNIAVTFLCHLPYDPRE